MESPGGSVRRREWESPEDCYKQAAHALQGFRTELTTDKLLADPVAAELQCAPWQGATSDELLQVGKFLSALERDFRAGRWESDEARFDAC